MHTVIVATVVSLSVAPGTMSYPDLESGPSVGTVVSPFKAFVVTGEHADKTVDVVQLRKEQTSIFVLIDAERWDRPTARYLKALDTAVKSDHPQAAVIAIWLSDEADKSKDYLPKAQQSLRLEAIWLAVAQEGKSGPADWAINADAHVTTVVVKQGKVTARFGYRSLNETDVRAVLSTIK